MTIRQILAQKGPEVVTIDPDRPLRDAVALLAARHIGAVVVASGDRPVCGILSERDVVRVLDLHGVSILDTPVARVMTEKVVTCTTDEAVTTIMGRMSTGKFRHVPVVEDGKLVGIISIGDVVKYRLDEMERESRALKEYILTA